MKFNPDTTAITITDPQIDYCSINGRCATVLGWDVSNLDQIAENIGIFIDRVKNDFDVIILQNEENEETYATNMPFDPEFFVPLCVQGTLGHDFHSAINSDGCKVIQKNHPSGFARKLGEESSELEQYLLDTGKDHIIHAGFLTGRCINSTIIGGSIAGFNNTVLSDLVGNPLGSKMQAEEEITMALFKSHYAKNIISSSEVEIIN